MKIIGILLGLVLLATPLSVDAISVSEIEKKLLQAQTEEDVENVILEIVTSSEYQKACQQLFDKMNSLPPPEKTQAYLDKALPILQDYETLNCRFTEKYWKEPPEPVSSSSEIICGKGTIENEYGQCVLASQTKGGGCLIATATYGSELAPQVQMLREIRDNSLLQTQSGQSFMESFNSFYYSFSPTPYPRTDSSESKST